MSENLDERLLVLLQAAREAIVAQGGELAPMLLVETADRTDMIHIEDWTPQTKRSQMYALGRHYGRRAEAIYFVADAWVRDASAEEVAELRKAWPEGGVAAIPGRGEGLMGIGMSRDGTTVAMQQRYERTDDGLVFQEVDDHEEGDGEHEHQAYVLEPFWRGAGVRTERRRPDDG